ncbi:MAG: hypothetical protein HYY16_14200 [Planctomycetes bacterium]|nr:hypothetical protein [Planctomycetota bacterium]
MTKTALWTVAVVLTLAGGLFAYEFAFTGEGRADCPGKMICPITGEEICKDQCPLIDPDRPDCPGKIECPLTGDLVCADRCPLGSSSAKKDAVPSCCRGRK